MNMHDLVLHARFCVLLQNILSVSCQESCKIMLHDLARIWFQNTTRSQVRITKDLGLFLCKILIFTWAGVNFPPRPPPQVGVLRTQL